MEIERKTKIVREKKYIESNRIQKTREIKRYVEMIRKKERKMTILRRQNLIARDGGRRQVDRLG